MEVQEDDSEKPETSEVEAASEAIEVQTEVFLAHRIDASSGMKTLVRVHGREFEKDSSLIPFSQNSLILEPAAHASRTRDSNPKRLKPNRLVTRKLREKRLGDTMRDVARDLKISKKSGEVLDDASGELDIFSPFLLARAEEVLREKKEWKDRAEELPFAEIFPQPLGPFRKSEDSILQEEDLTLEDQLGDLWQGAIDLPRLSTSSFFELMRPAPKSLLHQMARKLTDGAFFRENKEFLPLLPAAILFSRHVEEEEHFTDIMAGGLARQFPVYDFLTYKADLPPLKRMLRREMRKFFRGNRAVEKAFGSAKNNQANDMWGRFEKALDTLTVKQRHALEKLYASENPPTFEQAAKEFGISVDSLQNRLRGAIQKIRAVFPELEEFRPKKASGAKNSDLSLNGFWRHSSARRVHTLYAYSLVNGRRHEISPRAPRKKKVSPREIAEIKAHIYETSPIPSILDTEYFCGLKPSTTAWGPADDGRKEPEEDEE